MPVDMEAPCIFKHDVGGAYAREVHIVARELRDLPGSADVRLTLDGHHELTGIAFSKG